MTIFLELDSLPREVRQEESEIDVKDLTRPMQHDVSIVPVFGLKKVHHQTVGSQTTSEDLFSVAQFLSKIDFKKLFEF